ncbi:MAG TPA: hypothetical protein VGB53_17255 [Rubricoccaceae bacterium]|jgi:hypothetical protein
MHRFLPAAALWAALAAPAVAQHTHADTSAHAAPTDVDHSTMDHAAMGHGAMDHSAPHAAGHAMTSALDARVPMSADASGTSRIPDASPLEATMAQAGRWHLMLHAAAFPRLAAVDAFGSGTRGGTSVGVPNWAMGMAQRPVGRATLTLRAMASLDPVTESGDGYRLLFQSGETFAGERLVDRQHPHDAVSELSATVSAPVGGAAVFGYVGYPGEPALGPAAFMHRPSARYTPDAPLSHHWQDATHIAWGVATGGVAWGPLTLDASLFTGAEPDERRWTPDRPRFDSYSARVSLHPTPRTALQVSRGHIYEPEALEPGVNQVRTTASALYSAPVGRDGDLAAALVWGRNDATGGDHHAGAQQALLAEATLRVGRAAVFGRGEWIQKSGEELDLDGELGEPVYGIGTLGIGAGVDVARTRGVAATLGAEATAYRVPEALRPLYGRAPVSLQIFLRLSPTRL